MPLVWLPRSLAATLAVSAIVAGALNSLGGTWQAPPGAPLMATPRGTAPLPPGVTPIPANPVNTAPSLPPAPPVPAVGAPPTPAAAPVGIAPSTAPATAAPSTPAPAPSVAPSPVPAAASPSPVVPTVPPSSSSPLPVTPAAPTATPAPQPSVTAKPDPTSPPSPPFAATPTAVATQPAPPPVVSVAGASFPETVAPSVQAMLLPGAGGALTSGDGRITVTVPAAEVSAAAVLSYSSQPAQEDQRQAALRQGLLLTNVEFALSVAPPAGSAVPAGSTAPRAEIVTAYSPAQVSGIAENSLKLYQRNPADGAWTALAGCSRDGERRLRCTAPAQGQFLLAGAQAASQPSPASAGGIPWTALAGGGVVLAGLGGAAWWLTTGRMRP